MDQEFIADALNTISSDLGFSNDNDDAAETPSDLPDDGADDLAISVEQPAAEAAPAPAEEAEPIAPVVKSDPPETWRPEALAHWEAIPEAAKAEILKREEDIFRGLEGYKADAGVGRNVKSVFAPYEQSLAAQGINPLELTANLMQSHHALVYGTPDQKLAFMQQIAKTYGVPFGEAALGEAPYIDPQVADLQKQLQNVTSHLRGTEQRQAQEIQQKLVSEIDTFASDPAHSYFDEVASDVAALLRGGAAANLADAYEKAVWANPVTRAKEQARVTAEATAKAKADIAAKAEAVRKATSANVRSSAKAASATAPLGSIDDTLMATLSDIRSRS